MQVDGWPVLGMVSSTCFGGSEFRSQRGCMVWRNLKSAHLRRLLMFGSLVTATLFLIGQWFLMRNLEPAPIRTIIAGVASNVTALIVSSGLALAFFHYFIGREEELADYTSLDPQSSRAVHDKAMQETSFWYHEGHIGRWVRENSLTELARKAQMGMQVYTMCIAILDPRRTEQCEILAARRRNHFTRQEQRWDAARVQAEICATILSCALLRSRHGQLHVNLFLKPDTPPFRLDVCQTFSFITLDDALAPAIAMSTASKHYSSALAHFQEFSRNDPSAAPLDMEAAASEARLLGDSLQTSDYRRIALAAGLDFPSLDNVEMQRLVAQCSKHL